MAMCVLVYIVGSSMVVSTLQEERRIVYVGRIPGDFTRGDLRKEFEMFGPIEEVSVHFREHG